MSERKKIKKEHPTPQNTASHSFKLVFVVVDHNLADTIVDKLLDEGVVFCTSFLGKGTAPTQLLNLLGLEEQKDIVVAVVEADKVEPLLKKLKATVKTQGVAFSIRMNSIGGVNTMKLLLGGEYASN